MKQTTTLTQEEMNRCWAEANARAYFCRACGNWQLIGHEPYCRPTQHAKDMADREPRRAAAGSR